jgi:hypothetical protein
MEDHLAAEAKRWPTGREKYRWLVLPGSVGIALPARTAADGMAGYPSILSGRMSLSHASAALRDHR